jgi:hypothetical protein
VKWVSPGARRILYGSDNPIFHDNTARLIQSILDRKTSKILSGLAF